PFPHSGGPHCLPIALGQVRLHLLAYIQPHVFVVPCKALRREESPRLRIERPDVERHLCESMCFGELDDRLDEGVAAAPPLMRLLDGEVVNMQALPGMAQCRFCPSDDLGIDVADRFTVQGPDEDTRVWISKQLAHERCGERLRRGGLKEVRESLGMDLLHF